MGNAKVRMVFQKHIQSLFVQSQLTLSLNSEETKLIH